MNNKKVQNFFLRYTLFHKEKKKENSQEKYIVCFEKCMSFIKGWWIIITIIPLYIFITTAQ